MPTHARTPLAFDPDQLRAKYRAERDRRLRPDGDTQYVQIAGALAHYADDPYVAPGFSRAPVADSVDAVVVGGGFGGLIVAARLRAAGIGRIRIIEKGGDFGGTWYWNRYPGAACDIESYIYMPLLEELGAMPTEKYAKAPEILAHTQAIGRHFDLYRDALFQTTVSGLAWDDRAARWTVTTDRGDRMTARFVVLTTGPLNRPKLPGIPGVESFAGHSFHTSRWDYAYTGGTSLGGLDNLADKRVGIIGTGATAVQCAPHVAQSAQHLFVFQRTPSSIDVRNNRPTDPDWAAQLTPGWQRRRMENFNNLVSGIAQDEDLVSDGWTEIMQLIRRDHLAGNPLQALQLADFAKMEQVRARVDLVVQDPAAAAALKPWYKQFCKRPCFHDEYLQMFNRPNVTLVDTDGRGVERITPEGVVVAGRTWPLDCLIFATGFEVGTAYERRSGLEIHGRGGLTLTRKWADGARTLHGLLTRDFPNCFIVSTIQSALAPNFPHMLIEQADHIAYIVRRCLASGCDAVEPTAAGEAEWTATIMKAGVFRKAYQEDCTPGYYNAEGQLSERNIQNGVYGRGAPAFIAILDAWRAAGDCHGLEFQRAAAEVA
ncbi:NAD(P)/FAD-dependent oxidoreductase [Vineibacter terrae]|uniref:NAD(P)/FAD-dependent oxidoreductase n=1 Tax=Vineibacter terrae TaxID=2586908 RepID=A0A5C8PQ33_9HYPH|nr:NAD(P)/FAD-dependent oxidoreductase [Vineibacter terrae]TXL76830.1 NAD(P)/FAD-dependent oxidoreductase [Vineibacter terrae]